MSSLNSSPRRSRRFVPATLGLAATMLLAACSGDLPQPEAERAAAAPEPVLTQEQLDAVLDDVEVELTTGDASMNPDDLGSRITGTAREIRAAEYLIEAADPARPITLLPREDSMVIVPASNDWPRDIVVITEPPAESQIPRVMVLQQETPRDNFALTLWSQLLPGVSMPAMPLPTEGAQPLENDAEGFALAPGEVGDAFTDVLSGKKADDEDSQVELFAEDPLSTAIRDEYKTLKDGISAVGSVKKTFEAAEDPVAAFEALEGGAIVITSVQEITNFKIDSGSLNVSSDAAVLLDKESISSKLETVHELSLVFYVPPENSDDEITILGETRDLVEAAGK
ncbi:MAG TPA: hypothetical protein VK096_05280 [Actinomycetales bacterium]|nr:hypothetical protein [Actinomycetales bacterium]